MPDDQTPAQRYLRLAKECVDAASTFPDGEQRDALLQMAQVWQRLADPHSNGTTSLRPLTEREQPAMQQQQQVSSARSCTTPPLLRNLMTTCELPQGKLRVRNPALLSKGRGFFVESGCRTKIVECGCRTKIEVNVLLRVNL